MLTCVRRVCDVVSQQVKAILNGYVIKNFASFQTLVVKFLGLVRTRTPTLVLR